MSAPTIHAAVKINRLRSFQLVPVDLTQAMLLSAVETAGIGPQQALMAHKMFLTAAPDVCVAPLSRDILEFAKTTADARSKEEGNTEPFLNLYADVIQELLVASMGARIAATYPRVAKSKDLGRQTALPVRVSGRNHLRLVVA